jgi:hypothetical protein
MARLLAVACALFCVLASPSFARPHKSLPCPEVLPHCIGPKGSISYSAPWGGQVNGRPVHGHFAVTITKKHKAKRAKPKAKVVQKPKPRVAKPKAAPAAEVQEEPHQWGASDNLLKRYGDHVMKGSKSLAGVVPELANKARVIAADCGSRVVSAVRNTFVRGTRTKSLHASGRAVDMVGNPGCIRKHLASWKGGASNDYARVRHYHISWGGREHGRRFAHGGGGRKYAKRYRTRYAAAG